MGEIMRFVMAVGPATLRKATLAGRALKTKEGRRVVAIEDLGFEMPMYDITTGTGDFIAEGVVSHNCFARPTHEYLGMDMGDDFDSKIVVKVNAVSQLARELDPRRWKGEPIAMGTNTDPYQRAEGKYRLTRGVVELLSQRRNPFSILTKSTLVLRDLDLLAEAAKRTDVRVNLSIGTLDEEVWKATEPGTPHPAQRIRAIAALHDAGVPCGVLVAPVIPGLSDGEEQLRAVAAAASEAGARSVSTVGLHLRNGVGAVFLERLARTHPEVAAELTRRYDGRVNLAKADQQRISEVVGLAVRRAGRRLADRYDHRHLAAGPPPASASPPTEAATAEQLTLLG
jgi:DNA repair photolyase